MIKHNIGLKDFPLICTIHNLHTVIMLAGSCFTCIWLYFVYRWWEIVQLSDCSHLKKMWKGFLHRFTNTGRCFIGSLTDKLFNSFNHKGKTLGLCGFDFNHNLTILS